MIGLAVAPLLALLLLTGDKTFKLELLPKAEKGKEEKIELKVGESYPIKIIKLSPSERKIGLSIRALKSDEFRADWEAYQESAGEGTATLGDHFRNR